MKHFLLFIAALFIGQFAMAQIPISTARTTAVGQTVTITGVITNGAELGTIRYMQDGTGGLPIYDGTFAGQANRGDSVTVTGTLVLFSGLLEMTPVTSVTIHSSGHTVTPLMVTPSGMGPANEGELLQINDVTFANPGGTFTNGVTSFTAGNQSSNIYLRSGHPLLGATVPQTPVNVTGLSSQFNGSAQLLIRDANDIVPASTFYVTTSVEQSNLTTTGFDLSWETNTNGSSNIAYGSDENSLTNHISSSTTTNTHSVSVTGLSAGEIYYAKAYSVSGMDTAWSSLGVYATVSNSSGQVKIYFNQVIDWGVNTGTVAQYLSGAAIEAKLINYIDNAQNTIDVAIYSFNRPAIVTALSNAHNRGVQVRVICDNGTANTALQNGNVPFNWFTGNANGLMHNKFMVFDANSVNDCWLFMGSMNLTDGEINNNYNSVMFIQDQSLARSYEQEFIEMWGTNTATAGIFSAKLGEDKENNTPHKFVIGGIEVDSYFSPSDGTTAAISQALQSADSKVEFATLTFTRNDLRDDLINLHNAGINIRGMIENINDTGGEFATLMNAGISMKHHSDSYLLHHKYGIVDEDMPSSDPMVVVGSHNWTSAAEERNDENTLIFHDATIANLYAQEFNARWIGLITGNQNVVLGLEGFDIEILGNPAQNILNVRMTNNQYKNVTLKIYDTTGQLLKTEVVTNHQGNTQHQFNINALAAGSYIAAFEVDGVIVGERFVKL